MALNNLLMSYWRGNEASGNLIDAVGANTLFDNATVTSNPGKVYSTARQYTAANSEFHNHVDNPSLSIGGTACSIAAWVNMDAVNASIAIVAKDAGPGGSREYSFEYITAVGFEFRTWTATAGVGLAVVQATTFGVATAGTWYLVVATSDQTNNKISVNAGTQNSVSAVNAGFDGTADFQIGFNISLAYFNGRIGPVAFWKQALSPADITAYWNGGNGLTYEAITGSGKGTGSGTEGRYLSRAHRFGLRKR